MPKIKWKENEFNSFLEGDGFYISFNGCPWIGFSFFASDNNAEETAIVKLGKKENKFYILNGDFRKEYEKLIDKGFKSCLKFYKENIKHKSFWSD